MLGEYKLLLLYDIRGLNKTDPAHLSHFSPLYFQYPSLDQPNPIITAFALLFNFQDYGGINRQQIQKVFTINLSAGSKAGRSLSAVWKGWALVAGSRAGAGRIFHWCLLFHL